MRPPSPLRFTAVRIGYLGPAGTFTEEALLTQEDLAAAEPSPTRSVPDVIAEVEEGRTTAGLVPIENSIEGSVTVTLDTLAFKSDLLIQREIDLPISLSLCIRPGTRKRDVRTVLSHPQAFGQCRDWLAEHLPAASTEAANSTADAARRVARSKRGSLAAVANPLAAEHYGLRQLARGIEDHQGNQTRFVLVGRGIPEPTGHDRTSIVCFQRQNRPGSLLAILQEFAARAIDLTKLESRPTKQGLGEYCFFMDLDGHIADELVADALRNLAAKQAEVKFLGSYPVGGVSGAVARRRAAGKAWREADAWVRGLRARIGTGVVGST